MDRVDIKIGFSCNNSCKFCVQGKKREKLPDKTVDKIKQELASGRKVGKDVVFTGGEPTLRNAELVEMVRHAKKLGYKKIQIQTNGRLFAYKGFCRNLISAGANEFCPSLHGPDYKIHDFLTSSKGSFEQTCQGIINLKCLGQHVLTNTVITSRNYKLLPLIAGLLVDLKVDQFQFAFPHILGSADENKNWLVPKISRVMPYLKKALDIGIKAKKSVMTEAITYCFMQGYEQYIGERVIPDTKIFDSGFAVENYTLYRRDKAKIKGPACKVCRCYSVCEGPWREYPELFGWGEFIPLAK
ncbi:MAG: radical SAM protein [Candidatus Omnitrophica bacterium]|nr:radical SAM protein [Candidatus Omnitrophota bacterium]